MQETDAPRGLIVDLITPLSSDGEIDGRGLGRVLDRVLPHVQGVLVAGPHGGEGKALNLEMREGLLEKVLVVIQGRIPILMWVTGDSEEETRKTALALRGVLERRGYDGPLFWVDAPLVYRSNRGLPAYYRDLAGAVENPLILLNDPDRVRVLSRSLKRANIRTSVLKALSSQDPIKGLIFLGTLDRAYNYQKACRARGGFRIYDGDEGHFLDHPSMGGVLSLGANLAPQAWETVVDASLHLSPDKMAYSNHLQEIWQSGQYLRRLMETYGRAPVAILKKALAQTGIIESDRCLSPPEDVEEPLSRLRDLMTDRGDWRR